MSDVRLKNALTQIKNARNQDRPIKRFQSSSGEAWSVDCHISTQDVIRLKKFMQYELEFYNQLVGTLNPTARTSPETLSGLSDRHVDLFCKLAETGIDIRKVNKKNIPPELSAFSELLSNGEVSERVRILMESVLSRHPLMLSTKKAMVREILNFYIDDAKVRTMRGAKKSLEFQEFKTPPKSLSVQTIISKRHLQLRRSDVTLAFNEDLNQTELKTPYTGSPLIVSGVDLTHRNAWKILIIHQSPNRMAVKTTPWNLDFRGGTSGYLVEYLDNNNDKSGIFWQANQGRR